jgi:hypothetical protein
MLAAGSSRRQERQKLAPSDYALVNEPIHNLCNQRKVRSPEVFHLHFVRNRAQRGVREVEVSFGCTGAAEASRRADLQK